MSEHEEMRYVSRGTVQSLLDKGDPVPLDWTWKIISQAADALDAAHQRGLVHSNITPSSLLLDPTGDHVYLSDFGMAEAHGDKRADQFALACVAFELLTGTPPSGPQPSAHELRADVPAAADLVFARAMSEDPAHRYPTCSGFAKALGIALGLDTKPDNATPVVPSSGPRPPDPSGGSVYGAAGGWSIPSATPPDPGYSRPTRQDRRAAARAAKLAASQDRISRAVREAVRPGLLAFNPPAQMHQGRAERIEVGIARSAELSDELTAGFRGRGLAETLPVPSSPVMGVELRGASFEIETLSPVEQLIVPLARWEYDVTPVRAGSQTLTLCVSLRIDAPYASGGRIAVPVLERQIQIRVNVSYGIRRFTANNWQWVAGTVIGLGGGIAAWIELVH